MENPVFAAVYVDVAVDKPLDYAVPPFLILGAKPGVRVKVPLQKRICTGTILQIKQHSPHKKIEFIQALLPEENSIPEDLLEFGVWISHYYCSPFFKILKLLIPPPIRKGVKEKQQLFVTPLLSRPQIAAVCARTRGAQARVLEVVLQHPKGILLTALLEKTKTSRTVIGQLAEKKIISLMPITIDRSLLDEYDFFPTRFKELNLEQKKAVENINKSLKAKNFATHLLYGVTGSGKTEVYLNAIETALAMGKSVLFLVPEIILTSQTLEQLRGRFQKKVALLHHRLSDGKRRDTWQKIHQGTLSLIVGPRSALFSPIRNLGLIIVDEEHDSSYKQSDEAPCYHARDAAVMRGKICQATVILGSATPALESYANALSNKYSLNILSSRADKAELPVVSVVDMQLKNQRYTLFSEQLLQAIEKRLKIGEQSLIFLNRRGFHTTAFCTACEKPIHCSHCSISLTFHKGENILSCHLCGKTASTPNQCPLCFANKTLKFRGAGTEKVEKALQAIFPKIRSLRLDADTTRHKGSHEQLFKQFRSGKADILIGTQMIAKGLHFPSVTLVGILNADAALQIPDFRTGEQIFQLITQVAGRSGRSCLKGEVILQTCLPHHPTLQYAAQLNYSSFFQEEMGIRKLFQFPPFCHLIKLVFKGKKESLTLQHAQTVRSQLIAKLPPECQLYPVISCGHAKVKDLFRFQFLIKGRSSQGITKIMNDLKKNRHVHLLIDVDPITTY